MWDRILSGYKNAGRHPRLAHRESNDLRMTLSIYALLNASRDFRTAFKKFLQPGTVDPRLAAAFASRWGLPPRHALRDLAWSQKFHAAGVNPRARLLVGQRRYPGLERSEESNTQAWARKGYEQTPPGLSSPTRRAQSAHYLLLHLNGASYQTIAVKANRSVSTVYEVIQFWTKRLGYPPPPSRRPS